MSNSTMANLIRDALRHKPETITIGELRDRDNRGHQVFTTLGATSPREVLSRMRRAGLSPAVAGHLSYVSSRQAQ